MKNLFFILLTLFSTIASCIAAEQNMITDIRRDGEILIMVDGKVYETFDTATTSIWLTPCDVTIYNDEQIYNNDEDEDVYVIRIR